MEINRESMECDVLIVGAGPSGLAAAIRLAQLSQQHDRELSIMVLEKGAQVGAHILSGAILEPGSLDELIPDWQDKGAPIEAEVSEDLFYLLTKNKAFRLPVFKALNNHGNKIIRLSHLCRWLGDYAQSLGVNVFPGFAGSQMLYDCDDTVVGVQTGDSGLNADGSHSERFEPGINIYAKQTLLAEGCRGSLSETVIKKFNLRQHAKMQTYGIGLKEIWKVDPKVHHKGRVIHTVGWPLDRKTYGGSFIYHLDNDEVAVGFVVGLDYENPCLDPFKEFQRFKLHPKIKPLFENGQCIQYGAKALNEGGLQSIPKLSFPGGMLLGDCAGFLNVPKIKGIHNAIQSGMLAAKALFSREDLRKDHLINYPKLIHQSSVYKELYKARNVCPAFKFGLLPGLLYSAIDQFIFKGKAPWTLSNKIDYLSLKPAAKSKVINYPKPDKKITFDRLTQVFLSGTMHREDEPCHLILKDPKLAISVNYKIYNSPETRYCPAGVYEIVDKNNKKSLQINAQNCIHCKTCDIKDPRQNIIWKPPEGGEGPDFYGL